MVIFDIHALQVQPSLLWHMSCMSALQPLYTIAPAVRKRKQRTSCRFLCCFVLKGVYRQAHGDGDSRSAIALDGWAMGWKL